MQSSECQFSTKPMKPPLPKKLHCPLPAGRGTTALTMESAVKHIVEHLNQHDGIMVSIKAENRCEPCKGTKATPTIKPRPPLPQKREGEQKVKQNEDGGRHNNLRMKKQGGRSGISITFSCIYIRFYLCDRLPWFQREHDTEGVELCRDISVSELVIERSGNVTIPLPYL